MERLDVSLGLLTGPAQASKLVTEAETLAGVTGPEGARLGEQKAKGGSTKKERQGFQQPSQRDVKGLGGPAEPAVVPTAQPHLFTYICAEPWRGATLAVRTEPLVEAKEALLAAIVDTIIVEGHSDWTEGRLRNF